jgi:hypothetical protein
MDEKQPGVQAKQAPARKIDIVVFGATGLSGTFVVAELLKRTTRQGAVLGGEVDVGRRIGIAGRSRWAAAMWSLFVVLRTWTMKKNCKNYLLWPMSCVGHLFEEFSL